MNMWRFVYIGRVKSKLVAFNKNSWHFENKLNFSHQQNQYKIKIEKRMRKSKVKNKKPILDLDE